MYSTANDMGHFLACILNDGTYQNRRIIQSEKLRQLYSEYPIGSEWKYHLGIDVGLVNNIVCLNHNGRGYGFQTLQDIYPENNLGIAVLTNSATHPFIQHQIGRSIAADLFAMTEAGLNDCAQLNDLWLSDYVGLYKLSDYILADDDNIRVAITPRNGKLYFKNQELIQHNKTTFFSAGDDVIEFVPDGVKVNYYTYHK
jgi:CubicO group peptidase (beta-lactamase class C family)